MMEKLNIIDEYFSHAPSSSWYNIPKKFVWERNGNYSDNEIVVITDLKLVNRLHNKKVYGWLLESPLMAQSDYAYAKNYYYKFDGIFTFDKDLLNMSDKFILTPIGGCWIDEDDRKIHKKDKLLSMVYSNKNHLEGHRIRHNVANEIKNIDLYGSGFKPIENKITALKDYMFSIVIENCKKDYYFSEKLIDCFVTGTIPIYWGCPSIGEFFNNDSILTFNTVDELKLILERINTDYYHSKKDSILDNYEKSKKYLVCDDLIYEKLKYEK